MGDATRARLRAERTLKAKLKVPATVEVGATATFKTKGSRAKRGLRSIKITFGDGGKTTGSKVSIVRNHTYSKAGIYLAKLVVQDKTGKKAVARKNIQVSAKATGANGTGAGPPHPAQEVSVDPDTAPGAGAGSPAGVDLRGSAVPVQHQGSLNSCVSWTTAYALMGWYYQQRVPQSVAFAPMYVYSQTYKGVGSDGLPNGSYAADAPNVLQTQGVDTASHYGAGWASTWNVAPNSSQRANAANYRINGSDTTSGTAPTRPARRSAPPPPRSRRSSSASPRTSPWPSPSGCGRTSGPTTTAGTTATAHSPGPCTRCSPSATTPTASTSRTPGVRQQVSTATST